jgi:hypothetical protein
VLTPGTFNDRLQNAENKCWNIETNNQYIYKIFNQNIIICFVPQGFNIPPTNLLTASAGNQNIDKCVIIYSLSHLPGNNWIGQNRNNCIIHQTSSENVGSWSQQVWSNNNTNWSSSIDPLIIIFTLEFSEVDYPEWHKAKNIEKGKFYNEENEELAELNQNVDKNQIRIVEFKVDDYTILFVKENNYGMDKNKKNRENNGIDDLLDQILKKWGQNLEKEDIYVAVHEIGSYLKDVSQFKDKVNYICDFHHLDSGPDKEFCDLLVNEDENKLDLFKAIEKNQVDSAKEICKKLIEKIKELSIRPIKKISKLTHHVMHLFGPVDNDLQMLWEESVMTGRGGFNPEKWREVVNIYKDVDWKTNFHEALRLIEETIVEIKKSLQEEKKQKAEEILNFVKNAQSVLSCKTSNANSDKDENMVVLMTQAFCLLQKLKQDKMKEVYDDLESKNGLNPVHECLVKLDEMLEGLI